MNDDLLNSLRKEPRPEFAAALRERIRIPMQTQLRRTSLRFMAATLGVFALLAVTILLLPSAGAFAQGILKQVGGYAFALAGQPVNAGGGGGPIRIVKTLGSVSIETIGNVPTADNPVEASRMAGFAVLTPSYLPAGYSAMSGWYITSEDGGKVASNGYRDATGGDFLVINQWQVGNGAVREFNRPAIVDVTVRGHAGLWLPDSAPESKKALVWDENGITYSIITNAVPEEEVLKVAESLR